VGDSFVATVRAAGHPCTRFAGAARPLPWAREQTALARWIAELPKPVAVFVVNDSRGQRLLEACRRVGAAVPDEVAVLANENDELVCSMATPPLSSLIAATEKMGYEAARLLDRVMAGGPRPRNVVSFAPLGVATRQSTDVQAHADPVVARAVRFIREHAGDGIRVPQVLAQVGVSRTNLDRRFRAALGRTPHDEIVRVQLQRAMELLAQTTLKTLAVAEKAGFRHVEYMGVVFRKKLGLTPGEYRKRVSAPAIERV
jgi:LacI family transcriptional regulator